MNTKEIQCDRFIFSFEDLYKNAKKQFVSYEKIEGIPDWKNYDFSIDCAEDQLKVKDLLEIRFVEELTEASEAWLLNEKEHFWEEITDAFNFFISFYIMCDFDIKSFEDPKELLNKNLEKNYPKTFADLCCLFYPIIHFTGNLCNLLKNRPWSQSNYLVSLFDFENRAKKLWSEFWLLLNKLGLNEEELFILFEKKMKVNSWRIYTKY